jgi:uncharacterized protein YjiS (DUF1127 family)
VLETRHRDGPIPEDTPMTITARASTVLLNAVTGMTRIGSRHRNCQMLLAMDDHLYRDVGLSRLDVIASPSR